MAREKSSQRWLKEHFDDEYVKQAQKLGYRSRATFKLLEIDKKDRILRPGSVVVDLGAAPGGWSQIASKAVGEKGLVVGLDRLEFDPIDGVETIIGDFRQQPVLDELLVRLAERPVDLVLSDMAPNISGIKSVDQPAAIYLAELTLELASRVLSKDGSMVVKVFQGEGFDDYLKGVRAAFKRVATRKPRASRPRSREVYLVARDFRL